MILIDATPIKKFIEDGLNCKDPLKAFGHDVIEILTEIEFAPAVDAVEVVRCKDCKYRDGTPGQPNIQCYQMHDDDFCSYGERRADDGK